GGVGGVAVGVAASVGVAVGGRDKMAGDASAGVPLAAPGPIVADGPDPPQAPSTAAARMITSVCTARRCTPFHGPRRTPAVLSHRRANPPADRTHCPYTRQERAVPLALGRLTLRSRTYLDAEPAKDQDSGRETGTNSRGRQNDRDYADREINPTYRLTTEGARPDPLHRRPDPAGNPHRPAHDRHPGARPHHRYRHQRRAGGPRRGGRRHGCGPVAGRA